MNNKGFTLIEVIAVVAIIALLGIIATPSVLNTLNIGRESSDKILYSNIKTALQTMYEEIYYSKHSFEQYDNDGVTGRIVEIEDNRIITNIQTLVSNDLLTGINNENYKKNKDECISGTNCNAKIVSNSKNEDLGKCIVIIKKEYVNQKVSYKISAKDEENESYCPKTDDFEGV